VGRADEPEHCRQNCDTILSRSIEGLWGASTLFRVQYTVSKPPLNLTHPLKMTFIEPLCDQMRYRSGLLWEGLAGAHLPSSIVGALFAALRKYYDSAVGAGLTYPLKSHFPSSTSGLLLTHSSKLLLRYRGLYGGWDAHFAHGMLGLSHVLLIVPALAFLAPSFALCR
jgi:hypothetical protein